MTSRHVMRIALTTLSTVAMLLSTGSVTVADDVELRIAQFWRRVDALPPGAYLSSADLGQWALNVIERDATARITVADFRVATAGMQASMDRAGHGPAAPAPTPPANPDAALILKAGMNVTYTDGWKVTVLRSEPQAQSQYSVPGPGMKFIAVVIRYDNGTSKEHSFGRIAWKMQDSAGVRRMHTYFDARNDGLDSGQLAAGAFTTGSLVFEVPANETRASLIYEDFGYKLATWQLF